VLLSRSFPRCNEAEPVIVTVVVPAYNEEEHIGATLQGIVGALRTAKLASEIVVVLDLVPGDETASHVRRVSETYSEIRVIERRGRRGVGDAVRRGIKEARGKIVVIAMGDQSEDPADIVRLVTRAENFDVVFTNRFKRGRPLGYPRLKYVANRCCNLAVKLMFHVPYSDTTNAFKAYRKEVLDCMNLSSAGFEIFLEIPLKTILLGDVRTDEIDVHHVIRKKKSAKLSLITDGYKYVRLLLSLLKSVRAGGHPRGVPLQGNDGARSSGAAAGHPGT